jgi:mannose-1-phosphate guanylyltransferase
MLEHFYAVVMAGGGGTRLWPLSRSARPKQMLSFDGKRTLFQAAIDRLQGLFSADHILVVTIAAQANALQTQCPEIPAQNFLIEPAPRGTASVVGYAAIALQQRDPQAVMAVVTADHIIQNQSSFLDLLQAGYQAAQAGYLVTLGIQPDTPSTAYGYIQAGESVGVFGSQTAFRVLRFKEKPDEATARQFLARGNHFWNSGMFLWRVDRILQEFWDKMPELSEHLKKIASAWTSDQKDAVIQEEWPRITPETIDFGIMEKAQNTLVLPANELGWSDVGSWDSLFEVLPPDENGNIILGANYINLDTRSILVYSTSAERLIVTIGIKDLIVVDTGDALLICPKEAAQRVKEVVSRLKQENMNNYL